MPETYCGKSCAACSQKELLNCPGCEAGPGRPLLDGGGCEIAACCRKRGHDSCNTCGFKGTCFTLRNREHQPEYRKRKKEIANRAVILGKWLWVLFWLQISSLIIGFMANKYVQDIVPGLYRTGQILAIACSIVSVVVLFRLSSVEHRYCVAVIYNLIATAGSVLSVIRSADEAPASLGIIDILVLVVAFVSTYNTWHAHAAVLTNVDDELSEQWTKLWKWLINSILGAALSVFLSLLGFLGFLGWILLQCAVIVLLIVSVTSLVYLYQTAKVFREYPVDKT